jgi:hypothetical protein
MQRAVAEFEARVGTVRRESDKLRHQSSVLASYVAELQRKIKDSHQQ